MNKSIVVGVILLVAMPVFICQSAKDPVTPKTDSSSIAAARQVLGRVIGEKAKTVKLQIIPAENGRDVYEYEARAGF